MTFWDTVWSTVIALAVIGVLGFIATAVVAWIRGRLGRRPDWTLEYKSGTWILRRAKHRVAFEVWYSIGNDSGENVTPSGVRPLPSDYKGGDALAISELKGQRSFHLSWIDRRRCGTGVELEDGVKFYRLTSERPARRRLRLA